MRMAKPRMDLSAFVGKLLEEQDGDVLREGVRVLAQALMEIEVDGVLGAERYERTEERSGDRNGTRPRTWDTRVGTIESATAPRGGGMMKAPRRGLRLAKL
jgi:transposase-like protein